MSLVIYQRMLEYQKKLSVVGVVNNIKNRVMKIKNKSSNDDFNATVGNSVLCAWRIVMTKLNFKTQ